MLFGNPNTPAQSGSKGKSPKRAAPASGSQQPPGSENSFRHLQDGDDSGSESGSDTPDGDGGSDDDEAGDGDRHTGAAAGSLAGDILGSLKARPGGARFAAGGRIEQFLVGAMERALETGKDPPEWVMQAVCGQPVQDPQVIQVNPRRLQQDLDAEASETASTSSTSQQEPSQNTPARQQAISPEQTNTHTSASQGDYGRALKASMFPSSLKLEGLPSEDVPEIMAQYRTHISLALPEGTSEADLDRRAIKNLRLITKGAAATSLDLILSKSLEWRPEQQIAALRARGETITISPPRTWKEWVTAMTTLFAPANRIALLAREAMTLQAQPNETVDVFALRVSRAYSRLLAEAERTAPANVSAHEHAFSKAQIASFENGLPPEIRVEMVREDASQTFMASKTRARKHEANRLRSPSQTSKSVSALYDTHDPQLISQTEHLESRLKVLERMLEDRTDRTVSSASDRGRSASRGPAKRNASLPDRTTKHQKQKVAFSKGTKADGNGGGVISNRDNEPPCTYPGCAGLPKAATHCRRECRTESRDRSKGIKTVKVDG